jgi:hypothetical protein
MIESLEILYGPQFGLVTMGTGRRTSSSGTYLLSANAAIVARTLATVASRNGWAEVRKRSIGAGAPVTRRPIGGRAETASGAGRRRLPFSVRPPHPPSCSVPLTRLPSHTPSPAFLLRPPNQHSSSALTSFLLTPPLSVS